MIYGFIDENSEGDTQEESLLEKAKKLGIKSAAELEKRIKSKTKLMHKKAAELAFEKAADLRDEIRELKAILLLLRDQESD